MISNLLLSVSVNAHFFSFFNNPQKLIFSSSSALCSEVKWQNDYLTCLLPDSNFRTFHTQILYREKFFNTIQSTTPFAHSSIKIIRFFLFSRLFGYAWLKFIFFALFKHSSSHSLESPLSKRKKNCLNKAKKVKMVKIIQYIPRSSHFPEMS